VHTLPQHNEICELPRLNPGAGVNARALGYVVAMAVFFPGSLLFGTAPPSFTARLERVASLRH
jgi:hypothetical protein